MTINWWLVVAIIAPLGAPGLLRITLIAIEQFQEWRRPKLSVASQEEVERLESTLREVMPQILGLQFDDCLITDESSLHDFEPEVMVTDSLMKLRELYGVEEAELGGDLRLIKLCDLVSLRTDV